MEQKQLRQWKKVYENDLGHLASELLDTIQEPAVLILDGPLGAGKTTLVKECLEESYEGLSPSYSLLMEYGDILHGDFYRLSSESELVELELSLYLEDKKYFMLEWGKKFINRLEQEVPDNFSFYLLGIEMMEKDSSGRERRNYALHSLHFL